MEPTSIPAGSWVALRLVGRNYVTGRTIDAADVFGLVVEAVSDRGVLAGEPVEYGWADVLDADVLDPSMLDGYEDGWHAARALAWPIARWMEDDPAPEPVVVAEPDQVPEPAVKPPKWTPPADGGRLARHGVQKVAVVPEGSLAEAPVRTRKPRKPDFRDLLSTWNAETGRCTMRRLYWQRPAAERQLRYWQSRGVEATLDVSRHRVRWSWLG